MDYASRRDSKAPAGWIGVACKLPDHGWRALQVFGALGLAALAWGVMDTCRPVISVDAPPEVMTPVKRGKGFVLRYHVKKLRECPGYYRHFAVGQGMDGISHQLDREAINTFRRVGDPAVFQLQPYFPRYLPAGDYVIRAVVVHQCTGAASQLVMMDTAPVRVD